MPYRSQTNGSGIRAVGVGLGLALVALLWAAPDATAASPRAGLLTSLLEITVDDGLISTVTGDTPTYTITIQNLAPADLPGLLVTQSIPTGVEFGTADSGGTVKAGTVTWTVDLMASATVTLHTTMTVAATHGDAVPLVTVACASLSADEPPEVCASDTDQVSTASSTDADRVSAASTADSDQVSPASNAETGQATVTAVVVPVAPSKPNNGTWRYAAVAVVVLVIAAGAALVIAQRRAKRAGPS